MNLLFPEEFAPVFDGNYPQEWNLTTMLGIQRQGYYGLGIVARVKQGLAPGPRDGVYLSIRSDVFEWPQQNIADNVLDVPVTIWGKIHLPLIINQPLLPTPQPGVSPTPPTPP